MSKKQINFDPKLFSMRKNKSLKNGKSTSHGGGNIMTNLRKKIIKELNKKSSREHKQEKFEERQHKNDEKHQTINKKNVRTVNSNFADSLDFLETNLKQPTISHTKENNRQIKHTSLKKPTFGGINKHEGISIDLPSSLQEYNIPSPVSQSTISLNRPKDIVARTAYHSNTRKQAPNYGCLKGGVKPTYNKQRNITIRNNIKFDDNLERQVFIDSREPPANINNDNTHNDNTHNDNTYNNNTHIQKSNISFDLTENTTDDHYKSQPQPSIFTPPLPPTLPPKGHQVSEKIIDEISSKIGEKQEKRFDKPYVRFENKNRRNKSLKKIIVGKNGNHVSVMINNNKTRKRIKKEKQSLKTMPIKQIKDFLKERGFIEVGSSAPEDVLRTLFENAKLTGDVENKNGEVYVNNFLEDKMNNTDEIGDHI